MSTPKMLIAYDGSADARSAVQATAEFAPGAETIVFFARQPLEGFAAHLEGHPALDDLQGLAQASLDTSEKIAREGADLARSFGLNATPAVRHNTAA